MSKLTAIHTPEEIELFYNYKAPAKPIKFCSVDLRDGQQSLIATRMTTDDVLKLITKMDKVGFDSIEMWGGATFDVMLRYLKEDPFDRLRRCKAAAPNTTLRMLLRGQNIVGYHQYSDDVVEHFVNCAAEAGIDEFLIFDGLMDTRNCQTAIRSALKTGKKVSANLLYTTSPAHNDKLYVDVAKRYVDMGVQAIHIEDMAGMKDPVSVFLTVHALKEALDVPVHYQAHCTGGMSDMGYWEAVRAGADVIDCDFSALCNGTAHPPLESMVVALAQTPYAAEIDLDLVAEINADLKAMLPKYQEFMSQFTGVDISVLQHQIPGGMLSNMESQLKQMNAYDRLEEVLEETAKVHEEFGYPPLGTPFSQIVGTQATMNVIAGERYKTIPRESKTYMLGKYGAFPAPVDPEVQKKIIGDEEPITCRPADLIEPEWEKFKSELGDLAESDEDICMYALFPPVVRTWLEERKKRKELTMKYKIERID